MILAIDIGNTNIVIGCFQEKQVLFRERLTTKLDATDLEYAVNVKTALEMNGLKREEIAGAIISSVVPSVTTTVTRAVEKYCGVKPLVVGPGIKTGLSIRIDNPAQLGSDLVVAAVAGIKEYTCPMILIDMGTATTYSVIDENKNYLGGLITTGMAVSSDALVSRTSQLPRISFDAPKRSLAPIPLIVSKVAFFTATPPPLTALWNGSKRNWVRNVRWSPPVVFPIWLLPFATGSSF
jgi:type III pantothenate kinase